MVARSKLGVIFGGVHLLYDAGGADGGAGVMAQARWRRHLSCLEARFADAAGTWQFRTKSLVGLANPSSSALRSSSTKLRIEEVTLEEYTRAAGSLG